MKPTGSCTSTLLFSNAEWKVPWLQSAVPSDGHSAGGGRSRQLHEFEGGQPSRHQPRLGGRLQVGIAAHARHIHLLWTSFFDLGNLYALKGNASTESAEHVFHPGRLLEAPLQFPSRSCTTFALARQYLPRGRCQTRLVFLGRYACAATRARILSIFKKKIELTIFSHSFRHFVLTLSFLSCYLAAVPPSVPRRLPAQVSGILLHHDLDFNPVTSSFMALAHALVRRDNATGCPPLCHRTDDRKGVGSKIFN